MAEIQLKAIDELDLTAVTPWTTGLVPVATAGQTKALPLSVLRSDLQSSPQFTGVPTAPTPLTGNNSTQIATTAFVQASLAGAGLNPASSSSFGTVRTNTTDPVPVVYLKSEVDTLLANAAAAIRSVATGGTGASTAASARSSLGAAQSGSNGDITALTALSAVPTIIADLVNALVPPGLILINARSVIPGGWLLCDGSAVSRVTYSALFAAIGTTYGSGDGSTTFNLPNLRGRTVLGAGLSAASGTNRTSGTTGGADTHALTIGEMPSHTHAPASGTSPSFLTFISGTGGSLGISTGTNVITNGATTSAGGGSAHNNLPPFMALHYLIKT